MNKTVSTVLLLALLLFVFFVVSFSSNNYLRGFGLDLTEDKLYSVSEGTNSILKELDAPLELHFFFSDSTTKSLPSLRNYAAQVKSLLEKYSELGGQNIKLNVLDPKPFSEQEDAAASFGLTAASIGPAQDSVYFGLVGENQQGDAFIIGFFDPNKSAFLEYDISRLIYQLSNPEPVNLTIVTDIALMGEQNPLTGEETQPFAVYQQLSDLFNITLLPTSAETLPAKTQVLLVIHPQNFSQTLLYDIDQYLMGGGKAVFLVDPHFESDMLALMGSVGVNRSDLALLSKYGIDINLNQVVLDSQLGLEVRGPDGGAVNHFGFLGLASAQINKDEVTTGDLELINGASFAQIDAVKQANSSTFRMQPLITSTANSALMDSAEYAAAGDPRALSSGFMKDSKPKVLAARFTGNASSYFTLDAPEVKDGFTPNTQNFNAVVISDVDFITDRFWVQRNNFFGETMFSAFANNSDLLINLLENYAGAQSLIGLRGRGKLARPFERVENITVAAEARFREQETLLQEQLRQTEEQLSQLQNAQSDGISVSNEQQQAIDAFIAKRIETRRALREVQFQLQKDINALGTQLKVLNTIVTPLLFTFMLYVLARLMRRRAK